MNVLAFFSPSSHMTLLISKHFFSVFCVYAYPSDFLTDRMTSSHMYKRLQHNISSVPFVHMPRLLIYFIVNLTVTANTKKSQCKYDNVLKILGAVPKEKYDVQQKFTYKSTKKTVTQTTKLTLHS